MSHNLIKTMLAQSLSADKNIEGAPLDQVIWSKTGMLLVNKLKSPDSSFFKPYEFKTSAGRVSFLMDLASGPLIIVLGTVLSALSALICLVPAAIMFARAVISYLKPSKSPEQKLRNVYQQLGVGFGFALMGTFSAFIESLQFSVRLLLTLNHAMMKSADPELRKEQDSNISLPMSAGSDISVIPAIPAIISTMVTK